MTSAVPAYARQADFSRRDKDQLPQKVTPQPEAEDAVARAAPESPAVKHPFMRAIRVNAAKSKA